MSPERVVLVTGAASGVGAATARRLAAPGTALLLHTRRSQRLVDVAAACQSAGALAATQFGDLNDPATAPALVEAALAHFGRVDQLVANAGFADKRPFGELTRDDLAASYRTMPEAFFALATAALPQLEASPRGRVVTVSSFVAHVFERVRLFPASAAAKAALEALTKALAAQLAPSGTTVNAVAPGYVRKDPGTHAAMAAELWQAAAERTPLGRVAEPDDVAAAITFLLSDDARHITGQTLHVDGGLGLG